jgi:hypothetical protein
MFSVYAVQYFIHHPDTFTLHVSISAPEPSGTFGRPMHLLLMAPHAILASKGLETYIALATDRGVHDAFSPCLVLGPNMTVLLLLVPRISPATILFGTESVGGSMFPRYGKGSAMSPRSGQKTLELTSSPRRWVLDSHNPSMCTIRELWTFFRSRSALELPLFHSRHCHVKCDPRFQWGQGC